MLWYIVAPPDLGQTEEDGRILGAINAPDSEAARKKAERLMPRAVFTIHDADKWPLKKRDIGPA